MKEISIGTLITILLVMVAFSAYFSASETGIMTLNRYRLRHLAKQGHKGALRAEKLLQRPDYLISLVLIGNNVVNIFASALATIISIRLYGDTGIAIATTFLTLFLLIFAEIMPKTIAALYPEQIAFPSALLLMPLSKLMSPIIYLLNVVTKTLLSLLGLRTESSKLPHVLSKEELRTLFNEANPLISRSHQEMLLSILDLEKMVVEDVMIPRSDIPGIDLNVNWQSILQQLSQVPGEYVVLYREQLDQAIGLFHIREAYRMMVEKKEFNLELLLHAAKELYFIPEGTPLSVQLLKFQRNKKHVGLVVDEYGDIKGLVNVEDIVEVIVGDFHPSVTSALEEEVVPQADGSVLVDGMINIRSLNKTCNWSLPVDGPRTLNGLLLEQLEDIPTAGSCVTLLGYRVEILKVKNNIIKRVKMAPITHADM